MPENKKEEVKQEEQATLIEQPELIDYKKLYEEEKQTSQNTMKMLSEAHNLIKSNQNNNTNTQKIHYMEGIE